MTSKISLVIGIATAALAVGIPAALGEGRLVGSPEPDGVAYFYANERATLAQQGAVNTVSPPGAQLISRPERAPDLVDLLTAKNGVFDGSMVEAPVSGTTSGRHVEWPQIGVGFGVGILLALGLVLGLRHMRIRLLAH